MAVKALQENPDVSMAYGDANFVNAAGDVIGRFPAAQTNYCKLRQGYVHVPQQSAFFRAKFWQCIAPLDESFFFAMDYDLWVRVWLPLPPRNMYSNVGKFQTAWRCKIHRSR